MAPSSSSESIPLTKMSTTPRVSNSLDEEERDTLLTRHDNEENHAANARKSKRTIGAIWQITAFTTVGLLIALASGAFAYSLRGHLKGSQLDFIHAPIPGLRNPSLLRYFGGLGP